MASELVILLIFFPNGRIPGWWGGERDMVAGGCRPSWAGVLLIAAIASGCAVPDATTSADSEGSTSAPQQQKAFRLSKAPIVQAPSMAIEATSSTYSLDLVAVYPAPDEWTAPDSSIVYPAYRTAEVGDVTGDGRDDIVTLVSGNPDEEAWIFPQMQDGSLGEAIRYAVPEDYYGIDTGTTLADMNEDGVADLIVARYQQFYLLLSTPNGNHSWKVLSSTDLSYDSPPVVTDVDRDGHSDIVIHFHPGYGQESSNPRSGLQVNFGDGQGGFREQQEIVTITSWEEEPSLAIGDFNSDGLADIAERVGTYEPEGQRYPIRIFLHKATGGYQAPIEVASWYSWQRIAAGDFNGDGRDDLVIADGNVVDRKILFFNQDASGRLVQSGFTKPVYPIPTDMAVVDLDRDGHDDLVMVHSGWNDMGYYLQSGNQLRDEVLRGVALSAPELGPSVLAVGDINSDRCMDAVVATLWDGLAVLHGSNCSTTPIFRTMETRFRQRR